MRAHPFLRFPTTALTTLLLTMRTGAFALPGVLLSQAVQASPAYQSSPYDPSATLLDPEHNRLGAVASESSICSNIGIDMLKQGGNAADSLVATVLCVGVIGMYHSGIGGGGFMLVRSPNGTFENIDFREKAPAAASEDMYSNNVVGTAKTVVLSSDRLIPVTEW